MCPSNPGYGVSQDPDGDVYTNIEEYLNATDPQVKEPG